VRTLPRATIGTQYSRVFRWLCERCDRSLWVERSGFSTYFFSDLVRWWPNGRYVHLVRDGREAAISMSRRPGRYLAVLHEELRERGETMPVEELVGRAMTAARTASVPIERFGALWSDHVVRTHEQLREVPADRVLFLRYEHLTADPLGQLRRLLDFLGARE